MAKDDDNVRISLNLPKEAHEKLKALAAKEHRSNNAVIVNAIEERHAETFPNG